MNRTQIKIDRLEIRLKGGDANTARELSSSIGAEIVEQISGQITATRNRRPRGSDIRIGQIDAGTVRVGSDARSAASRTAIGRQIAARVSSRIAKTTSRGKG